MADYFMDQKAALKAAAEAAGMKVNMAKVTIGLDPQFVPLLDRLIAVLDDCNLVTQQQLIEFLAARHALRTVEHAEFVVSSMHGHIRQLVEQDVKCDN